MIIEQYPVDLSIIVVACNAKDLMDECLTAVQNSQDTLSKEVIYVDNGSTDGSVEMVQEKFPDTVIIKSPTNLGFIRANNLGYPKARGKYILMLNSDAFVGPDSFQICFDFMESHSTCGAMGCHLIDREGNMQPSARRFPTPWNLFLTKMGWVNNNISWLRGVDDLERDHQQIFTCDWVPGCYLWTRKKITDPLFDEFGFFLREDFFMYFDDSDLCLRIKRKGWEVYYHPTDVIHLGGANSAQLTEITEKGKLVEKYSLESEYIYFRKNYNIFYVFNNYFLTLLYASLRAIKNILKRDFAMTKKMLRRIVTVTSIVLKTRFGSRSIH